MTVPVETRDQSSSGSGEIHWDAPEMLFCLHAALDEDLGPGDVTAISIVPADAVASAKLVAKQELVLAGLPLFERVFWALSQEVAIEHYFADGDLVAAGAVIARLEGPGRPILSAERTALNFLSHLSGVATLTRKFTEQVTGTRALIRDTRKTMPMLRALEKYAVRAGGGRNHRFGLFDAVLIKENHIAVAGSVAEAVRRARAGQPGVIADPQEMTAYESFRAPQIGAGVPIQVEVRNETEMREALAAGSEGLLLDNLDPQEARRLVDIARSANPGCVIEVSGGVNLGNVRAFAESGADFIAIGALTHSAPAADLSLLVEWAGVE
jgi:nicotinate-nucleotide pyrophosphorylase (carboxylating)